MNRKTKKLNEQNNLLDEKINEENQRAFTDMICYLRGSDISEYDIELVRQDLTEMVLSAQDRGENIDAVIKDDYKKFCDEIIANIPPKTRLQKIFDYVDMCCQALAIVFTIYIITSRNTILIIKNTIEGKSMNYNISISVGSVISGILIILLANIIVRVIMKDAFKKESKYGRLVVGIAVAVTAFVFMLIAWLGKSTLFTVNIFLACAVTIILYVIHKIISII